MSEQIQCSTLLSVAGEDAVEVYNTFVLDEAEQNIIEPLIEKFEQYCTLKENVTFERHVFNTRSQGPGEHIDSCLTELRKLTNSCEFGILHDSLIKDRIVCGISSAKVKARLLREDDPTLEKTINICRIAELSKTQLKNFVESGQEQVGAIGKAEGPGNNQRRRGKQSRRESNRGSAKSLECTRCGRRHEARKCPAYGKTCRKCQKPNHFAVMCRSESKEHTVNVVREDITSDDGLFIGVIGTSGKENPKDWNMTLEINDKKVTLKLDTGAQCNVMSLQIYTRG